MHNNGGNVGQAVRLGQQLPFVEKAAIDEVVAFHTAHSQRQARVTVYIIDICRRYQVDHTPFPQGPGFGGLHPLQFIVRGQQLIVTWQQLLSVAAKRRQKILIMIRIDLGSTTVRRGHPVNILITGQKNAP